MSDFIYALNKTGKRGYRIKQAQTSTDAGRLSICLNVLNLA
ncbi:MAG: hypothetical protein ACJAUL_003192 [Paraglaciecola sp.]|jgi:hypothetical protein